MKRVPKNNGLSSASSGRGGPLEEGEGFGGPDMLRIGWSARAVGVGGRGVDEPRVVKSQGQRSGARKILGGPRGGKIVLGAARDMKLAVEPSRKVLEMWERIVGPSKLLECRVEGVPHNRWVCLSSRTGGQLSKI